MYLVFDVGATFVKYAWMDKDGEIIEKNKMPTRNKEGDGVYEFVDSLVEVYESYKKRDIVEGIALGLPGQIDVKNGIVYNGGGIPFMDRVHLGEILSKRCDNVRVSMENDGKCAALAEIWKGNAKDVKDACVLVFGTGVGGGIIINRRVLHGNHMLAGELSFCFENMKREDIGRIAQIEKMVCMKDAVRDMPFLWSTTSAITALCYRVAMKKGLMPDEVNGELIYEWAQSGDEETKEILEEVYFSIAKHCCNLYVTLDPEIILIGGGISAQPAFIEGIQKYVNQLKGISQVFDGIRLDVCKFRNDSNLLGALYNFMQKYEIL